MKPINSAIDEYISQTDEQTQVKLIQLRTLIQTLVPEATEKISYQMPTFYLCGNLIHFAAFKNHIGLYPGPSGVSYVQDELIARGYTFAKGSIQFPLDQPLPIDLITQIVIFRSKENKQKHTNI